MINNIKIVEPNIIKNIEENKDKKEYIFTFKELNIKLSFRFVSKDIVNVVYYNKRPVKNKYVELFEENFKNGLKSKFQEKNEEYIISNGYLDIHVNKNPFFYDIRKNKESILKQAIEDEDVTGKRYSDLFKFTFQDNKVTSIKDSFFTGSYEKFYGFGEKFSPINKRGHNIESWNIDACGVNSEKSYKNIPFFLNTAVYGLLINTTCRVKYNLASISFNSFTIELEDSLFDYYFIEGPSFKNIISKYIDLTGKLEDVPPKWSFGLWVSKYGYKTRKEIEDVADSFRKRDIPADLIWYGDTFWLRDGHYVDFVLDEAKFPNSKEMISSLKEKGFKVGLWLQPTVSIETDLFKEGVENNYFLKDKRGDTYLIQPSLVKEPEGDYIDFSKMEFEKHELQPKAAIVDLANPSARTWFISRLKYLIDWGIKTSWVDFGEIVPEDAYFSNGKTGKEMHNIYANLWCSTVFNFIKKVGSEKPLIGARSGWIGSHRYPMCFSGDPVTTYESMRNVLRGGLSLSFSGYMFWGHCMGGLLPKAPSNDLYIRWCQFGLFSPYAQLLSIFPNEPWRFGAEAEEIFRRYDKLRYSLIPYIYSCAYESVNNNIPLIRPLILEYQEDPLVEDIDDEYLFGNSFLVAPVFNKKNQRFVYLPKGNWIDYWTKELFEGGKGYTYNADIKTLPLFVKSGAIIPMQGKVSFIENKPIDKIMLDIYPDIKSDFRYKDDYDEIVFECFSDNKKIEINISNIDKAYKLIINNYKKRDLIVNGKKIKEFNKIHKRLDQAIIHLDKRWNAF